MYQNARPPVTPVESVSIRDIREATDEEHLLDSTVNNFFVVEVQLIVVIDLKYHSLLLSMQLNATNRLVRAYLNCIWYVFVKRWTIVSFGYLDESAYQVPYKVLQPTQWGTSDPLIFVKYLNGSIGSFDELYWSTNQVAFSSSIAVKKTPACIKSNFRPWAISKFLYSCSYLIDKR